MQALFPKTNFRLDHISPVVKLTIDLLYCDIPLEAFHKLTLSVQKKSCGNVANVFLAFCLKQQFIISRSSWDRPDNAHCNWDKSDFFTDGRWHFTCHVRPCRVAAMASFVSRETHSGYETTTVHLVVCRAAVFLVKGQSEVSYYPTVETRGQPPLVCRKKETDILQPTLPSPWHANLESSPCGVSDTQTHISSILVDNVKWLKNTWYGSN